MKDKSSLKKEVLKEAKQLLYQGKSRQETFQALLEKHNNAKIVADIVKDLPSAIALKKYGFLNIILLVLLIVPTILMLLSKPNLWTIVWAGFLIYTVANKNFANYAWVSIVATCGLIGLVALITIYDTNPIKWTNIIIAALFAILYITLPIWIKNKLCPNPSETKERYFNTEGHERIRIRYEFRDI